MMMEKTESNSLNSERITLRRSSFALCPLCDKVVEILSFDAAAEVFKDRYSGHRIPRPERISPPRS